jgi:(1->4)-alpha-D-glucan 1-alpha-D-glucosylmutase
MFPESVATYRVQLRPGFGFDQAAELAGYLRELGVSHVFTSPYLQAVEGSTHGYDVVDPTRVNRELGGERAHERMCRTFQHEGLGHVIDVVPNHMAIAGRQNPWWWDVLENGPSSRYATFFDVDWEASDERWPNKVLLPVLGDHYGRILEDGQLQLSHQEGVFVLHYHEHSFPIDPSSLAELLGRASDACGSELLAFIAQSHGRLPRPTVTARQAVERRHRDKAVLVNLLARLCREDQAACSAIQAEVERLNHVPDGLDNLIDHQNYRLALWRTASRDLGYRRFFDVNDLVGLRAEDLEVFQATHALPVSWVQQGKVQGLRIDHPDGLRDPARYFLRLREACPDAWIVAEKILEPGEKIPDDWPIHGTTGYDFLNLVEGLFIDPEGESGLTSAYAEMTGADTDFESIVRQCKRLVLDELLGSELNRLTSLFVDVCERHRRHRDYTRFELREALRETAACFPVYRSYVSASRSFVGREDEHVVVKAVESAMAERTDLDPELFRFLKDLLLLRIPGALEGELAMRFQQLSSPAMAKGVEDTAFYRFHRLSSLNEVGGDPTRFGVSADLFHQTCAQAQEDLPLSLLASTTHDTKRSEDVRSRLALLSEMPARWEEVVRSWMARNESYRTDHGPDRNTEMLIYQTLVGAWPIGLDRMSAYMEKAIREAKDHTTWTQQNQEYERTVAEFLHGVMEDSAFVAELEGLLNELDPLARINSLARTLLKLTAPGVPDIYQGTELWDLSLVDPDNRRPVDFGLRRELLKNVKTMSLEKIMAGMDQGLPKLWLTHKALQLRRSRPEFFGPSSLYRPLFARGPKADHVVAFVRGDGAVAVAPRLVLGLGRDWQETVLELPEGVWRNVLTGEEGLEGEVRLEDILALFPVALFSFASGKTEE